MNARRLTLLLALLLSLTGLSAYATPTAAGRAQLSAQAKLRDRNAKGQFLPKVNDKDIAARAFGKYEARNKAAGMTINGKDREDWASAKRELQDEKMAENVKAKLVVRTK